MPTEPPQLPEDFRDLDVDGLQDWIDGHAVRLFDARRELGRRIVAAGEDDADELIEVAGWIALCQADIRKVTARFAAFVDALEREEATNQNTPFTDADALRALRALLQRSTVGAALASSVARQIGARPTQSDIVRAGLALGRLAREGKVVRLIPARPDRQAHLWSLPGRELSEFALRSHTVESRMTSAT